LLSGVALLYLRFVDRNNRLAGKSLSCRGELAYAPLRKLQLFARREKKAGASSSRGRTGLLGWMDTSSCSETLTYSTDTPSVRQ